MQYEINGDSYRQLSEFLKRKSMFYKIDVMCITNEITGIANNYKTNEIAGAD